MTTERNKGFTLVELAISLMVIGLLLGGILKGKELIENAKLTATIRLMNEYKTAALAFRNAYGEYPGETKNPAQRLPDCDNPVCSLSPSGYNDDDRVSRTQLYLSSTASEAHNFFVHISKAGLSHGPEGGDEAMAANDTDTDREKFFPRVKMSPPASQRAPFLVLSYMDSHGSLVGGGDSDPLLPAHYYFITTTGKHALLLDRKMDDAYPFTGIMRHDSTGEGTCLSTEVGAFTWTTPYDQNSLTCSVKIYAGF